MRPRSSNVRSPPFRLQRWASELLESGPCRRKAIGLGRVRGGHPLHQVGTGLGYRVPHIAVVCISQRPAHAGRVWLLNLELGCSDGDIRPRGLVAELGLEQYQPWKAPLAHDMQVGLIELAYILERVPLLND